MTTQIATQMIAAGLIHLYLRPSVHGPGSNASPLRHPRKPGSTVAMITTILSQPAGRAVENTASEEPKPLLMPATSVAAKVIASSTIQPPTPDQNTDRQTPWAAALAAPCVSSEMCAEASYPVCVY